MIRFLSSLAALLVATEIVLRTWLVSPLPKRWDPELGDVNRAGARVVWSREGWGVRDVNSLGLLGPEPSKNVETRRVLLLGNSYTEGLNVARAASFEGRVEASLDGVEVLNGAHSGWSMAHELALLERIAPVVAPDVVVAQVSDASPLDPRVVHVRPLSESRSWELASPPPPGGLRASIKQHTDFFAERSALVTMLLNRLNLLATSQLTRLGRKFGAADEEPPRETDYVETTLDEIPVERAATRWIVNEMRALGAPVVLLVIPSLEYGVGSCEQGRPQHRAMIHSLSEEMDWPLVDPSDRFCEHYLATSEPGHGFHNLVVGEGHLNELGHALLAEELVPAIRQALR